jgi:hypothetical protein
MMPKRAVDVVFHEQLYCILAKQVLLCCNPQAHTGMTLLTCVGTVLKYAVSLMSLLPGAIYGPINALGNQDQYMLILHKMFIEGAKSSLCCIAMIVGRCKLVSHIISHQVTFNAADASLSMFFPVDVNS